MVFRARKPATLFVHVMRYARMGGFAHSPEAYDGLLLPGSTQWPYGN
jgi:hypothetical protein